MVSTTQLSIVLVLLTVTSFSVPGTEANVIAGCYETWSRCSRWSSWLTNKLWNSCNDRCKEDFKKRGGNCVLVPSKCPTSRQAYQCQCY